MFSKTTYVNEITGECFDTPIEAIESEKRTPPQIAEMETCNAERFIELSKILYGGK